MSLILLALQSMLSHFFSFRSQILQERGSRMWGDQEPELNNTESTKTNLLFLSLPHSSHHHCHSPCPSSCGVPFHSEAPWQSHLLQCCHTILIHLLVSSSLYVEHFSGTFKREYVSVCFPQSSCLMVSVTAVLLVALTVDGLHAESNSKSLSTLSPILIITSDNRRVTSSALQCVWQKYPQGSQKDAKKRTHSSDWASSRQCSTEQASPPTSSPSALPGFARCHKLSQELEDVGSRLLHYFLPLSSVTALILVPAVRCLAFSCLWGSGLSSMWDIFQKETNDCKT